MHLGRGCVTQQALGQEVWVSGECVYSGGCECLVASECLRGVDRGTHPPDGHWSEWYLSYWNAFLKCHFTDQIILKRYFYVSKIILVFFHSSCWQLSQIKYRIICVLMSGDISTMQTRKYIYLISFSCEQMTFVQFYLKGRIFIECSGQFKNTFAWNFLRIFKFLKLILKRFINSPLSRRSTCFIWHLTSWKFLEENVSDQYGASLGNAKVSRFLILVASCIMWSAITDTGMPYLRSNAATDRLI